MKSFSGFKERDLSQPTSRILLRSRGTVVLIKKFIHQAQWPSTVLTEHKCKHSLFASIHTKFRERCRYVTLYSGTKVDNGFLSAHVFGYFRGNSQHVSKWRLTGQNGASMQTVALRVTKVWRQHHFVHKGRLQNRQENWIDFVIVKTLHKHSSFCEKRLLDFEKHSPGYWRIVLKLINNS